MEEISLRRYVCKKCGFVKDYNVVKCPSCGGDIQVPDGFDPNDSAWRLVCPNVECILKQVGGQG
jgi:rRNA maturation protein Nop10